MKIKAINKNVKSMKLSVPIDGIIDIDVNGIAEVSPNCGKMLIEGTHDWKEYSEGEDADEPDKEPKPDAEDGEHVSEGEGGEKDSEKQPTDEEVIAGLEKLSLQECINMATEAGYPVKEWKKLSKNEKAAENLMRKYLIKKFKNASKK